MWKTRRSLPIIMIISMVIVISGCGGGGSGPNVNLPGTLIITEVGSSDLGTYSAYWLEVYNNSPEDANLSNFKLRSMSVSSINYTTSSTPKEFALPSLIIHPGSYVVIRGKVSDTLQSTGNLVYVIDTVNHVIPYWSDSGFVELIKEGQTTDFVRFGTSVVAPITTSEWTGGSAPALPSGYGYSIARDGSNTDNHGATDWVARDFATPGGPNDVTSDVDADQDGIPDCSEQLNSTFAGLPLYDWGARTGQKDIFIHVDYMDSADPGVIPRKEALDKVREAFAAHGYAVHFDVGDLYSAGAGDPANYNLDGRSHRVPLRQTITISETGLYQYKNTYMLLAKRQIFHYMLMALTQDSNHSSGVAELDGNDLIITLGEWNLDNTPGSALNELINFQAGTIMHELGHNLGLQHGGDVAANYKPNYYSIMNYLYQIYGLPVIGNNEGDRYYLWRKFVLLETIFNIYLPYGQASLINGPNSANMTIDYSSGDGREINENAVVEDQGLRQTGSKGVDFNGNGYTNDTMRRDLNNDGSVGTLYDYHDWDHINLFFIRDYWGDTTGTSKYRSLKVAKDPIGNDKQTLIVETLIPPKNRLK